MKNNGEYLSKTNIRHAIANYRMQFIPHYSSSSGNLYSLLDGDTRLLLECGVSMARIRRAVNFGLSGYRACLLTHCHGDHARSAVDVMAAGIDLYCSQGTADMCDIAGHRFHAIRAGTGFCIGNISVMPFAVEHDAPDSLGYLIAGPGWKLLFCMDTYYLRYRFPGLTHIAIECNYSDRSLSPDMNPAQYRRLVQSHMSLETLVDMLAANDLSRVREIHLLHLSDANADADYFRDTVMRETGRPVFVAGAA